MRNELSGGFASSTVHYTVAVAAVREGVRVLGIAGGTGDPARAFAGQVGGQGMGALIDIHEAMLCRSRDSRLDEGLVMPAAICDGEALPFADDTFDVVSVAFSLCNMPHKERA